MEISSYQDLVHIRNIELIMNYTHESEGVAFAALKEKDSYVIDAILYIEKSKSCLNT